MVATQAIQNMNDAIHGCGQIGSTRARTFCELSLELSETWYVYSCRESVSEETRNLEL